MHEKDTHEDSGRFKEMSPAEILTVLGQFIGHSERFTPPQDRITREPIDETGLIDSTSSVEEMLAAFRSSGAYDALRTLAAAKNLSNSRVYDERPREGQRGTHPNWNYSRYPNQPQDFERRKYTHGYDPDSDSFSGFSEYLNERNLSKEPQDISYAVTIGPDHVEALINGQPAETFEETRLAVTRLIDDMRQNLGLGLSGA